MKIKSLLKTCCIAALSVAAIALTSCNKDKESKGYSDAANVAVTSFSLNADYENTGLDSVYFAIDLENGVIFNADSLRKGTKIDKVVANVKFATTVSEAVFVMSGGTTREGELDYKANPTDSIDFTGDVLLRVKADDGAMAMTYRVKVNVHKTDPDLLQWDKIEYMQTASRLPDPKGMKTVKCGEGVVSLIEENDGTYSASTPVSLEDYQWSVHQIVLPFHPVLRTLVATDDSVWVLDDSGNLWKGTQDMAQWTKTAEIWSALIGNYKNTIVGLKKGGNTTIFAQYPDAGINPAQIPDNFPIAGFSNFVNLANKWTSSPVGFFTGGITASGEYSDSTWAFDGRNWIELGEGGIPALEGSSLISYYNYRPSASGDSMIEYNVWMLLGGRASDGTLNRTVYISYDNGVNWAKGAASMQLPDEIPSMAYCDNIVVDLPKSANLSDAWSKATSAPRRINYELQGDVISWGCPYIFMFGGYSPEGRLYTTLWRGVLNRLTFAPVI